jgi:hypothetical protein
MIVQLATKMQVANLNCIILNSGSWTPDHSISGGTTPSAWTTFINGLKAVDPNIKVLAMVDTFGSMNPLDISNPSYRAMMFNAAQQLLQSAPFDGWNDDFEMFTGQTSDLIAYWQGIASKVKSMGLIATVDTEVEWGHWHVTDVYPYLTNFDYIMPMYYTYIKTDSGGNVWDLVLSNSPPNIPVLMGLDVNQDEMENFPLSQQLGLVDQMMALKPHSNLAGFSIWCFDVWNDVDYAAWVNWPTKDNLG